MKKIILILIGILCLGVVSAESGEYYYEQGSYYLSVGDIENARDYFEQAKLYLYGEELNYVEDMLDTLDRVQSENTEPLLLNSNWYFIGEINDEDVVTQIYYDSLGNNAIHSIVDGETDVLELEGAISSYLTSLYINGIYGYESSTLINNGVNSYLVSWYCDNTDTSNTVFVTYYGDKPNLFDSEENLCPTSNYWIYILVGLVVLIGGYLTFNNFRKKKKIKKP